MAFEKYVHHISCVSPQRRRESSQRNNKYRAGAVLTPGRLGSTSAAMRNKGSKVRIVLSSGMVEVYEGATPASAVMEKYPAGLCLARPEVFKRPHDSLVGRKEMLLPGQKFYLVPETTLKKLRENCPKENNYAGEAADSSKKEGEEEEEGKCDGETAQEHVCSAKDFYASHDKWTLCSQRRLMKQHRPFRPPIKSIRMRHGLLDGWSPSLPTVAEELSQ